MTSISRVTHRSMGQNVLTNLQGNLERVGKLQQQLSSGKLISKPSDSPAGTVSAMETRSQIRTTTQYARNADDAVGWMGAADNALTNSLSMVGRARDLALQGISTGVQGAAARAALATEVEKIREGLLGLANTTYAGRPVFGGTTSSPTAYSDGVYDGDGTPVMRRVGDNANVRVDLTGPEVYGIGDDNLFGVLERIAYNLEFAPDQLNTELGALDGLRDGMLNAVADIGARQSRVENMRQIASDRLISLNTALGEVESIDLPATIMELQMQTTAYEAALGAAAKVIQPSLVDFLR